MTARGLERRPDALERLGGEAFDLLVIGGGIVGSRIAYEAALAGLRVALVDAGDFAGATSGASSKFIHGGLRYFPQRRLGLVRESQRERVALLTRIAPHLVWPMPVVLTMKRLPAPVLSGGLLVYNALSRFHRPGARSIARDDARNVVPALRGDGRRSWMLLPEAQTHDARLTLATVAAAERAGAVVANYMRVAELHVAGGRVTGATLEGREGEGTLALRCRSAVNAAGPWVDEVRRLEDARSEPLTRLSKGSHVILPLDRPWPVAVTLYLDDTKLVFAVPWQGVLMLGVTDTPYDGDPAAARPDPADVDELLGAAALVLPEDLLRRERVLSSFSGLRVLPPGEEDTARASREHLISVGPAGMVSVAGGKLTTHRLIAMDALRRLPSELRPHSRRPSDEPLPGARAAGRPPAIRAHVDDATFEHLFRLYGDEVDALLAYAEAAPDALERIHRDGPDLWAQAYHAVNVEWTVTVEDVVCRRTTVSVRGLADADVRARIASVLARRPVAVHE